MSTQGGKLRSNWRLDDDDSQLGSLLLGSNIVAGSFLPAAAGGVGGASNLGGGFVAGSFASQLSGAGFLQISAFGALSAFYGGGFASGYKVFPIAFQDFSGDGVSSPVFYAVSATQALASVDSIFAVGVKKASQTVGSGVMFTSASNISVHFMWTGWIVSSPAAVP